MVGEAGGKEVGLFFARCSQTDRQGQTDRRREKQAGRGSAGEKAGEGREGVKAREGREGVREKKSEIGPGWALSCSKEEKNKQAALKLTPDRNVKNEESNQWLY